MPAARSVAPPDPRADRRRSGPPSGDTVHYFGYGSLVNRATRPAGEIAYPAALRGWRRAWNHRVPASDARLACTALSIDPLAADRDDGPGDASGDRAGAGSIDGVVVALPAAGLAALDAREANYDRLRLPRTAFVLPDGVEAESVHVYRSTAARRSPADAAHPILASYADCVMAGYLERFGTAGLEAWIATTDGWEAPRLDDRARPAYPRAVASPAALLARFDALLPSPAVPRPVA